MRYIGGKYRIRKQLIDYLLNYIQYTDCFVEPFVGSANITLSLFEDNPLFAPSKIIINDFHTDLAMMWQAILNGWEPPSIFTEEEYESLRNAESSALRGFVGHGCSFGGIWFSKFAKTKDGRNYCLNAKNSIMKVGELLKGIEEVEVYNLSYEQVPIPNGALIYNDPPYKDTCKPGAGNDFDHEKFWQWVRELSNKCQVFTSEYSAPEDFECVLEINVELDMNRAKRVERLFKYKGI
ncbi:MAG: DNA adenine methylase [Methanothrix sp.]|nr:DNA adenine methylase [Methanothrix sp.]